MRRFAAWSFSILVSLAVFISYADRSIISSTIIPMAEEFDWNESQKSIVLMSFFLGYGLTQTIGGYLSDVYDAKCVLTMGLFFWSVFTAMIPFALQYNTFFLLILMRFLVGFAEGVTFPAIQTMISHYIPKMYSSTVISGVTAVSYLGVCAAFFGSPLVIHSFGWRYVFWLAGILGLFWLPFWLFYNESNGHFQRFPSLFSSFNSFQFVPVYQENAFLSEEGAYSDKEMPSLNPFLGTSSDPMALHSPYSIPATSLLNEKKVLLVANASRGFDSDNSEVSSSASVYEWKKLLQGKLFKNYASLSDSHERIPHKKLLHVYAEPLDTFPQDIRSPSLHSSLLSTPSVAPFHQNMPLLSPLPTDHKETIEHTKQSSLVPSQKGKVSRNALLNYERRSSKPLRDLKKIKSFSSDELSDLSFLESEEGLKKAQKKHGNEVSRKFLLRKVQSSTFSSPTMPPYACDALENAAVMNVHASPKYSSAWKILRMLLKRKEVWAICICQYCQSWGLYGLISWLPSYLIETFHVEYNELAVLAALPYVGQSAVAFGAGFIADFLLQRGFSLYGVRVSLQSISMVVPAIFLLLATKVAVSPAMATTFLFFGTSLNALSCAAVSVNQLDIGPKFAGLIFGAGNTCGILAGIVALPVSGYVLQFTKSWTAVFSLFSMHYFVGAIFWARWIGISPIHFDNN